MKSVIFEQVKNYSGKLLLHPQTIFVSYDLASRPSRWYSRLLYGFVDVCF